MTASADTVPVRVRFCPSPTGTPHVGLIRTALFNWAYARHVGGTFVFRIEDTDPARDSEESYQQLLDALRWLGLDWDEGVEVGGPHEPYRQSQRYDLYRDVVARLLEGGYAYESWSTPEEIEARHRAAGRDPKLGYDGFDRDLTEEQKLVQQTARDFAKREIEPKAAELDKTARWPTEIVAQMAELGFLGLAVPEQYGGAGLDNVSYALVVEEVSRACASCGVIMSVNNSLFCDPLEKFGTDAQKAEILAKTARGEWLGAFGQRLHFGERWQASPMHGCSLIGGSINVLAERGAKRSLIATLDLDRIDQRRPEIAIIGAEQIAQRAHLGRKLLPGAPAVFEGLAALGLALPRLAQLSLRFACRLLGLRHHSERCLDRL